MSTVADVWHQLEHVQAVPLNHIEHRLYAASAAPLFCPQVLSQVGIGKDSTLMLRLSLEAGMDESKQILFRSSPLLSCSVVPVKERVGAAQDVNASSASTPREMSDIKVVARALRYGNWTCARLYGKFNSLPSRIGELDHILEIAEDLVQHSTVDGAHCRIASVVLARDTDGYVGCLAHGTGFSQNELVDIARLCRLAANLDVPEIISNQSYW